MREHRGDQGVVPHLLRAVANRREVRGGDVGGDRRFRVGGHRGEATGDSSTSEPARASSRRTGPVATLVTRETKIAHSGLGIRARKVARRLGAETVGDLAAAAARLRKTRGCGKRTEGEILKLLEAI